MTDQNEPKRPNIMPDINDALAPGLSANGVFLRSDVERIAAHGEAHRGGYSVTIKTAAENEFKEPPPPAVHRFESLDDAARAFSRLEPGERDRVSLAVGSREVAHKLPQVEEINGREVVTGEKWEWVNRQGVQRQTVQLPDPIPERPQVMPGQEAAEKIEQREAKHLQIVAAREERNDNADKVLDAAREVLGDAAQKAPERDQADDFAARLEQAHARRRERERTPGLYRDIR